MPALRKQGFSISKGGVPQFAGWEDWTAVQNFFEIGYSDTKELFSMFSYDDADRVNPLVVAEKITSLLETA